MTERPILFSAPMVRAILDGSKSKTRRVVKGRALEWLAPGMFTPEYVAHPENKACPYGHPGVGGSLIWVREAWSAPHAYDHLPPRLIPQDARIHYAATEERGGLRWRPSIHMPRWASRITLEVTGVRVERLQDISEVDALAEGVRVHPDHHGKPRTSIYSPVQAYRELWESINGDGSWSLNPWVWCVEFKQVKEQSV